jgi:hypothetical protein
MLRLCSMQSFYGVLEYWSIGVLEYWKDFQNPKEFLIRFYITPLFQYPYLSPGYCILDLVKVFIIPRSGLKRTVFYWKEGKSQS